MINTEIEKWLRTTDSDKLEELWKLADTVRLDNVGDEVHLRGLLEISNYCCRACAYCGINCQSDEVTRYRMNEAEIMEGANKAAALNYGTVVMQSGEDYGFSTEFISNIVRRIKQETPLAVTLSFGERSYGDLKAWKEAGADRYLLRFETSNPELYNLIHPKLNKDDSRRDRIAILKELKEIGYEVGSGVMIGIPGQSYTSLAEDIKLFAKLDLDMIGVGPYIPDPNTPLGAGSVRLEIASDEQVPNSEIMTYKVIALARLMCPQANIPSTTALATLNKARGRELGLMRGANVVMPNITQPKYRIHYTLYPNKACLTDTAEACHQCMQLRIESIRRKVGQGQGGRKK
ncbi:MAG: [FeFe] hydrogenase H-cluster radical SAM maturase HydE [Gammaproteobacteria bacterium GWE2_37_16]|nr:MAG: [FeFe] hydrogenase H-cluster radical SAM maturase HydE [Gammaproteobacteria bacterium GWE2_37_16]